MKFIDKLEKKEYEEFVKKHEKSHFLQSYAWGQFSKEAKGLIPYYVGLKDENNKLVATALLLKKKLPLGYSYFYSPRGFVVDFNNFELLNSFTSEIIKFTKKHKSIFLKIDPDIIWSQKDCNDLEVKTDNNAKEIFDNLKKIGFKHLGFTQEFETMQPRYTFRIDMTKSIEEIENNFSKTTKQRIKKAESIHTDVKIGNSIDIEEFNKLMTITENRKNFVSHDLDYYKKLYEIYNKDNKFLIFLGSVDLKQIINQYSNEIKSYEEELKKLPNENLSKSQNTKKRDLNDKIMKHKKLLDEYTKYQKEYGNKITLNAHAIIIYNDKAWVLYAGNHNILTSTYSNYKTYYEHIKYCHDNGIKMYDQFGSVAPTCKYKSRLGLYEFKKKFGGNFVEFIGEFDLITNKIMYLVFTKLVPLYRNIIRNIAKRKKRDEE